MKLISLSLIVAGLSLTAGAQTPAPATLNDVWAPVKVATPPSDAYIGLSKLDDGEIRHYNYGEQAEPGRRTDMAQSQLWPRHAFR